MTQVNFYSIGTQGQAWDDVEKATWLATRSIKRSYQDEVLNKFTQLDGRFEKIAYGSLPIDPIRYPLFAFKSLNWDNSKPTVLITGGVHGYETSGVQGAIQFLDTQAEQYSQQFNFIVAPCISPWGYETINRWNPSAIDPNRSFVSNSPAEEAAQVMALVTSLNTDIYVHIDLHETTDSDETEFRPALAARDGKDYEPGEIPDGFYLVGDSEKPQPEFQQAMIANVAKVTHIAPADKDGNIIGAPLEQHGVINYPTKKLGLCAGLSDAVYCTTTEVYPDSPLVTDQNCNDAQVAAITAGLDYVLSQLKA